MAATPRNRRGRGYKVVVRNLGTAKTYLDLFLLKPGLPALGPAGPVKCQAAGTGPSSVANCWDKLRECDMSGETLVARVIQLEELVSHQEHLLQQLNNVVSELRSECDDLKDMFGERCDRLESLIENQSEGDSPDEKPPHY